jgi:hypothetical protein
MYRLSTVIDLKMVQNLSCYRDLVAARPERLISTNTIRSNVPT